MKSILTTAILFFGILNGVQSQTMEGEYYKHLTRDTVHKRPQPQSITFKGNKVIVVWNRNEWMRMQRNNPPMRRGGVDMRNKIRIDKPKFDKWIPTETDTDEREPELVWENPLVSRGKIEIHNWVTYNLWWGSELGVALYIRLNKK